MKPAGPLTLDDEDEAVAEEENKVINEVCTPYTKDFFVFVCCVFWRLRPNREIIVLVISNMTFICSTTFLLSCSLALFCNLDERVELTSSIIPLFLGV